MDQIIVTVLAIVALYWGVRVMPGKSVTARAHVTQDVSSRRVRTRR